MAFGVYSMKELLLHARRYWMLWDCGGESGERFASVGKTFATSLASVHVVFEHTPFVGMQCPKHESVNYIPGLFAVHDPPVPYPVSAHSLT